MTMHTKKEGLDPVYGKFAGQGDHSLSVADVDGDGCQEIIYGAAVIDHDGSLLYSSYDHLPDGRLAKLGHGDAMHVARINPDLPGYQIFNVFEVQRQHRMDLRFAMHLLEKYSLVNMQKKILDAA